MTPIKLNLVGWLLFFSAYYLRTPYPDIGLAVYIAALLCSVSGIVIAIIRLRQLKRRNDQ